MKPFPGGISEGWSGSLVFFRCYPGKEELPNPKDSQKSLLCVVAWGVGVLSAGVSLPGISFVPSHHCSLVLAAWPGAWI